MPDVAADMPFDGLHSSLLQDKTPLVQELEGFAPLGVGRALLQLFATSESPNFLPALKSSGHRQDMVHCSMLAHMISVDFVYTIVEAQASYSDSDLKPLMILHIAMHMPQRSFYNLAW